MDRETACDYLLRGCPVNDWETIIYDYCIERGKEPDMTNLFIALLESVDPLGTTRSKMVQYILEYYAKLYNIVFLYNSNNQLITVF